MSLAILSMGTALPSTIVSQQEALRVTRALCCRTEEQATWLPAMYSQCGIDTRRLCLGDAVLRDVLEGTRFSESPFLPTGAEAARGPTTAERMRHYAELAPPLAVAAAGSALKGSGLP